MKLLNQNKGVIAAIIIFVSLLWLYNTFFSSELVLDEGNTAARLAGTGLVNTFSSLEGVTFDQTIFSHRAYQSLIDFSVIVPAQPVGRPNPFNTIGRD